MAAVTLLKHFMLKAIEVAQSVGVRVLLIHAKDDAARSFYRHYGFVESPIDSLVLMILLPKVSRTGPSLPRVLTPASRLLDFTTNM